MSWLDDLDRTRRFFDEMDKSAGRLTTEQVQDAVANISSITVDDESAHVYEDELHVSVLVAIAADSSDAWAAGLAREALRTCDIDFSRWCA